MKAFILKILAGSAIRLAVLSVLILGMASACQAQAFSAPAQPTARAVVPATAPAAVVPVAVSTNAQGTGCRFLGPGEMPAVATPLKR